MSVPSKNIPTRIRSNPLLTALADALAGAIGSVVAALAFYPIDIAKTRAQAQRNTSSGVRHDLLMQSMKGWQRFARSRTLAALFSLVRREGPLRIFAGIEAKALQALLGSFVYFYAYAFVKVTVIAKYTNCAAFELAWIISRYRIAHARIRF